MHLFDHDISNFAGDGLPLKGSIIPNWSINGNPHGGYLMAVLAGAVHGYKPTLKPRMVEPRPMENRFKRMIERMSSSPADPRDLRITERLLPFR